MAGRCGALYVGDGAPTLRGHPVSKRGFRNQSHRWKKFSWQEGYGAFSVNVSIVKETIRYIKRQAEHHQHRSFKDEYIEFLKKHGVDYDERYVWD